MNESSKIDFDNFIKNHQTKEEKKKQYLNDWSHLHLSQESCPVSYQKIIMKHAQTTRTTNAFISILLPETIKMNGSLNRNASSIIFWSTISSQNTPEINLSEINNAIKYSYKSRFSKVDVNISVDSKQDIFQSIKDSNISKDINKRTIVHFISDLSPDFNSFQKKEDQFRQLHDIIKSTYHCGLHIIDCNQAGIYYPRYQEILKETEYTMQHQDLFVFFSCLENQKVPKLPGLPNDLFTSFLISPAKTALLYHSHHYYGFNHSLNLNDYSNFNGHSNSTNKDPSQFLFRSSLSPLTIEQINAAPDSIFDNLMTSLRCIVEAMFCESDFFSTFFRHDKTVSDIFIGFAVAQHFFSSLQIKPFSYPSFPENIANHPLWSNFDLRLDAALMTLTYGSSFKHSKSDENDEQSLSILYNIDNIPFSEQELQTIKLLIESNSPLSEFAGHITFLPNCLLEKKMMKESIEILTDFIEFEGLPGIQLASKFPIFPSLVQIAKCTINDRKSSTFEIDKNIDTNKLLICMSKLYVFYPNAKDLVPFFNNQYLTSFTVFHLRSENPLAPLVLFTLMLKLSDTSMITLFLKCNWISITECLIQSSSEDVRIWTLLLVSSFARYIVLIDQILQLIDAISNAVDDSSPQVRVAFLVALQSIPLGNSTQIESSVLELALKLIYDMSPAVRRELASLLVSMKTLQKATSFDNKVTFNDRMISSNSMSTSDFFSESGSDANLDQTAAGISAVSKVGVGVGPSSMSPNAKNSMSNFVDFKNKSNLSSFSFSTKAEINKILSSNEANNIDESNGNQMNQKIILNALKFLSTDPFKAVTIAALIHDDETQRNFTFMQFFNHYISPNSSHNDSSSFSPSFASSSFLTSSTQNYSNVSSSSSFFLTTKTSLKGELQAKFNTNDLKRAKIENLLTTSHFVVNANSTVKQSITSNVTFSPHEDHLIFGTDGGFTVSYSLQQQSSPLNASNVIQGIISQSPITHVECDDNNGFPLLLVMNNSGDFYAGDYNSMAKNNGQKKIQTLTSFRVFLNLHSSSQNQNINSISKNKGLFGHSNAALFHDFEEPPKNGYEFEFEFDSRDSRLFFYAPKTGYNVNVCDLVTEQKIGEIIGLGDKLTYVHSPRHLSDLVFVCNENLYLYDCRVSFDESVMCYKPPLLNFSSSSSQFNKVFNCSTFKKERNLVCLCTQGGSVFYNDLRNMGGDFLSPKKSGVFECPFADAQILSFDVSQETMAAAVGTTKGGYACFYPGDKKIPIQSRLRQGHNIVRLKWMNGKPGLVFMQNFSDIQSCIFT